MPLKLAALVVPLALDTFAVSAALGVAGLSARERLRLSLLLAAFEAGMPIAGFLAGSLVGDAVSSAADAIAIALLVAIGVVMLREKGDELDAGTLLARTHGIAAVGLGLSVSLDELAIGVTIGLLRLPLGLVVALIAAQAVVASQLGSRLGARVGAQLRDHAERIAGGALILLAVALLALKLVGRG